MYGWRCCLGVCAVALSAQGLGLQPLRPAPLVPQPVGAMPLKHLPQQLTLAEPKLAWGGNGGLPELAPQGKSSSELPKQLTLTSAGGVSLTNNNVKVKDRLPSRLPSHLGGNEVNAYISDSLEPGVPNLTELIEDFDAPAEDIATVDRSRRGTNYGRATTPSRGQWQPGPAKSGASASTSMLCKEVQYRTVLYSSMYDQPHSVIIDVRTPEEFAEGYIPQAHLVPVGQIGHALSLDEHNFFSQYNFTKPSMDDPIIFYCLTGVRSGRACDEAQRLGFRNSLVYKGSWDEWKTYQPQSVRRFCE